MSEVDVRVEGDRPGQYAAVCYTCVNDETVHGGGCGPTRYYKREATADANRHRWQHDAWERGERGPAWPT